MPIANAFLAAIGIGYMYWTRQCSRHSVWHIATIRSLEVPMTRIRIIIPVVTIERTKLYLIRGAALLLCVLILPLTAHASPFDTGISSIQTLFTGTIAKAASLIAIVIGGYTFAHGEPGAKKTLAGVAAGTGIAIMATNVLTWLWGS